MCGIVGIYRFNEEAVDETDIVTMASTLRHRGPDALGSYCDRNVGLGHTRLSIIDLVETSNQPFHSADGRYTLTYNGEVFNYVELRSELEQLGHRFRTQSDTEVVLTAYIQWGAAAVNRFNGMWAFAVYDHAERNLFCSRDRFGIKPFVYAIHRGCVIFASEAKAILAVHPELRRPNFTTIAHCVRQSLAAGLETTCFEKILRLLPAMNMIVSSSGHVIERYWDYPRTADRGISKEDAAAEIARLMDDAVRIRMRSDVPVGLTLSSGVDSSAVARLMRAHSDEHLSAYTSHYGNDYPSESDVAAETSKQLDFQFTPVSCSADDFLARLRKVVHHVETPHSAPAMLALWEIMKTASRDVKVMLEGQGADELFGGYFTIYFGFAVRQALREGRLGLFLSQLLGGYRNTRDHPLLSMHYFFLHLMRAYVPSANKLIRRFGRGDESVYVGPLRNVPDHFHDRDGSFNDLLNKRLRDAHQLELVELLHYGDAISMAHSIESRLPFMDYRLVEHTFRLPGEFKIIDGKGKQILREALRDIVPHRILKNQRKLGFVTPISKWLRRNPDELVYPVLDSHECRSRGIFDVSRMRKLIARHVSGERDYGPLIFRWLTCEIWFREFIDSDNERISDAPAVGYA